MSTVVFCFFLIGSILLLTFLLKPKQNMITDNGYPILKPNPFYLSGSKQMIHRKHNMLRISKLRRK